VNIGTKTALERQMMGDFEPLTEEELLASSVRAGPMHARSGGLDERQSRALAARRRQVFNRDEIDDFKAKGCLGEARDATIALRRCDADADNLRRRTELVAQENADRAAILDWIASGDDAFADAGRSQLVDMYHRLLVVKSKQGDWVEDQGGWMRK
jgi:hypothetical protein